MVKIRGGDRVVVLPDELVGFEPPSPYVAALFRHTAKMDAQKDELRNLKASESVLPAPKMLAHVKMLSLFPNIYSVKDRHRTFSNIKTSYDEADHTYRKRTLKEKREMGE